MPEIRLTAAQARVLGSLIEKEIATPEYYPLSLNSLLLASNQRSSREPVMNLDEEEARQALHGLEEMNLAGRARSADGRVAKYEHWAGEVFNFTRAEIAVICVLLLRGPQTPGELRVRTDRLHHFEELEEVTATLEKLMQREPSLVAVLPRQPGSRESRYAHLLSGGAETMVGTAAAPALFTPLPIATPAPQTASFVATAPPPPASYTQDPDPAPSYGSGDERVARLEAEVRDLRQKLAELTTRFNDLFAD